MKKFLLIVLCVLFALTIFVGCSNKDADSGTDDADTANAGDEDTATEGDFDKYIYFGLNYELTGANPIVGESSIQGVDMAVDEINAAGGITVNDETYGLAYKDLDNGFNTDEAALNAQEFADDEEICAMIGPNDSDMCMATQAIVTEEGIPAISPWSTLVELTSSEWYFRACFTDDFQGEILAKYAYEYEEATTAAVLYDMSNPYNEVLRHASKRYMNNWAVLLLNT